MDNLQLAIPEIFLLTATCTLLVVGLFVRSGSNTVYWSAQSVLAVTLLLVVMGASHSPATAIHDAITHDLLATTLRIWILLMALGLFLYSRDYINQRAMPRSEYFVLALFAVGGMMIMVSSTHMLSLYLGLELLALSQYAMVALHRDNSAAAEAAMKYFVLGALASGILLYGLSMIYGATSSLDLTLVEGLLSGEQEGVNSERLIGARFGLVFILVGIAFKLGAVPFHMWVPDVYEGAPNSVTMFIATIPKLAAFAMLVRLLVDGLQTLSADWQWMLAFLSALSMVVGNLIAIAQSNIKRMFAYSTISHIGFLLMGMVGADIGGYSAAMFYAIAYALTTLAAFGVLLAVSRQGFEADQITDLAGLGKRHAWLATMMLLAMFSLAGVPPMVGFYAKLTVLQTAVNAGFTWLAVLGVVMSVIGAFYYLRIVRIVFFDDAVDSEAVKPAMDVTAVLTINGLSLLAFGLLPGAIMAACVAAFA